MCVTVPVVQIEKAWQFLYNKIWCAQLTITGWWFGTVFIFHNIWDNPSHWLIFFRGVETTNQISYPAFFQCVPHVDESLAISMDGATKRTALLMYKLDLSTMGRWPTDKQVQRNSEVSSIVLNWTSYNNVRYTRVVSCPMDTIEYIVPINQIYLATALFKLSYNHPSINNKLANFSRYPMVSEFEVQKIIPNKAKRYIIPIRYSIS